MVLRPRCGGGGTYNELGGSTSPFPYMLQQTRKNFSGYVFSSIWRLTLFFSWGWFGWVNLQYISILSRARSRNFLSQGMLQKHGFFFQRDTQSGSYVGSTTYMSRFFLFLSPLLEFAPVIRFLSPVRLACMMVRLLSTMWEVGVIHRLLTVCKNYIFCECIERPSLLFLKGETRNTRSMLFLYWWILRSAIRYLKCGDLAR